MPADDDVTMGRLEDQIDWYNRRSLKSQRLFKTLKLATIVAAATVPLCAGLQVSAWVTGGLGSLIAALEGIQQLNQYHHNWITYRSTCEALKHEKYLYLAGAGPYVGAGQSSGRSFPVRCGEPQGATCRAHRVLDLPRARQVGIHGRTTAQGTEAAGTVTLARRYEDRVYVCVVLAAGP